MVESRFIQIAVPIGIRIFESVGRFASTGASDGVSSVVTGAMMVLFVFDVDFVGEMSPEGLLVDCAEADIAKAATTVREMIRIFVFMTSSSNLHSKFVDRVLNLNLSSLCQGLKNLWKRGPIQLILADVDVTNLSVGSDDKTCGMSDIPGINSYAVIHAIGFCDRSILVQ